MANQRDNDQESKRQLLPLFLDLSDKLIVIFGGGTVGERKAELFSRQGRVKVLSRDFSFGLVSLSEDPKRQIELLTSDLAEGLDRHMQGAFIVIPATNDSMLNRAIEAEARRQGILVNSVEGVGDVVVPSVLQKGSISIAITTENPALTKYLRMRFEDELGENLLQMARLLSEIRKENKERVPLQKDRARIIWQILKDEEIWRLLEVSYEKAYKRARSHADADERDSLDAGDTSQGIH